MRTRLPLLAALLLAACPPLEENCLLRTAVALTDGEAAQRVADGGVILSSTPECVCVRDRTVAPAAPASAATGYCASPCAPGCPAGTRCEEVASTAVCLRSP